MNGGLWQRENGVIFRFSADGKVEVADYIQSTSEEMQEKIVPILNEIVPKVRKYFEDLLKEKLEKRR